MVAGWVPDWVPRIKVWHLAAGLTEPRSHFIATKYDDGISGVDEVWIAGRLELAVTYLAQYLPATFKKLMRKQASKWIKATLASVEGGDKRQ